MADILLDPIEMEMWNEAGSRGDAFRRATLDRAAEAARLEPVVSLVVDPETLVIHGSQGNGEPDPESIPPVEAGK